MKPPSNPRRSVEEITADLVAIFDAPPASDLAKVFIVLMRNYWDVSFPPLDGNKKDNKKFAERVLAWIEEGDTIFSHKPLFVPLQDAMNDQLLRWNTLSLVLRHFCNQIVDQQIGEDGRAGYQQKNVANLAAVLCEVSGKELRWSSSESDYRRAASLLFEALTGESEHQLERGCEAVAKRTQTEKR